LRHGVGKSIRSHSGTTQHFSFFAHRLNFVPSYIRTIPESNFRYDDLVNRMMSLGVDESPQEDSMNAAPVRSSIIFEEDDLSPFADLSRPSMENHASARDLMCHMHGMSPVRSKPLRPRLSNQSLGSLGTGYKHIAASPFPQAPISATAFNSHKKSLTFDFVET
jgi:hypothetical protein